ncbi:MAG TPA: carboxypeptidase-like regulatory domain-containing protein [Candidatus Eisenbacteria bacterium]|nr:carboxypeptidase-like regulatory domain-containing protein [Candidatus Eisenbacteria bacterium]
MKVFSRLLFSLMLVATGLLAQTTPMAPARATVEGMVTRDPDGMPVHKALIELIAENQAEAGDYTAMTGADGTFRIEDVMPGRYHLFAERTGLLDTDKQRGRNEGRMLTITAGEEVKDIHIRLQAAAVVRGRVTDEDGDPLANAEVTVFRQTFVGGHNRWEQAGAERTNDLGEYRVANLAAGNVYISVNPPPDFRSLIEASGAAVHEDKSSSSTYQTTYYPGTPDRSQASPVQLHAGDDFPANFSLTPSPSLSIRGSVVNLPPRASASIMLQSRDFSVIMTGAEIHKDGTFVFHDVSPGNYTIMASVEGSAVPMTARQSLQVGSTNVEGLRLSPQAGAIVQGHVRFESRNQLRLDPERIFLTLQMVDAGEESDTAQVFRESFSNIAHVAADGSFQWTDVPAGNYYVQIVGDGDANGSWYIKSVSNGGRDVNDAGINVNGGTLNLDLVASANGGVADGIVVNSKGEPFANAIVVAAPEARMRGRVDHYRKTVSDQTGHFSLRGLRPGDYTIFAWESVEGEAYYNPDFVRTFDGQGTTLHVSDGDRKSLQVQLISPAEDQP